MKVTSEHIREARRLLTDPNRWNKDGHYFAGGDPDSGCFCMYGALGTVLCPKDPLRGAGYAAAWGALHRGYCSTRFNDDPDTTHAMMLDHMDKVITHYEAKEAKE